MKERLCILCSLVLALIYQVYGFTESGYIVTSPSMFRSGVDHVVSVRIFNHPAAVRVNVKLVDLRENLIASVSEEITGDGSLVLKVPSGQEGKANLKICGNCHLTSGFRFQNSTAVTVVIKGSSAFIQTDKPVYKPSQTVSVNIYLADRDLRPVNHNVTAYVVAPNDVRIMQWKNLSPMCCGVISFSFPLSDQPVLGTWTIFAEVQQQSYNATFEIQKYVLPKFEVGIDAPPFFRNDCEEVTVNANYVFGEPVEGHLKVNMSVHGIGYSKTRYMDRGPVAVRDYAINGQVRFTVCLSELLPADLNPHFRGALHVYAEVTSQDGSKLTAYDDTVPVSRHMVDIEFTEDTREHFKAGIPFKGKIIARNLDGSGAPGITVSLNVAVNHRSFFRQEIRSNAEGIISFTVPSLLASAKLVWLEARVFAIRGELAGSHYLSIYRNLHNWFAPGGCHLLAQGPGTPAEPGSPIKVLVKSSCPCNFTLFHEILARGNIVQTGRKEVLPDNSDQLSSRQKRSSSSFGDAQVPLPSDNGEVVDNQVCQTSLIINVTPDMAPTSRLLVYYVREDGEGVADSIQLPIKSKLDNEVQVTSDTMETKPGDDVNVQVTSDPGSCVCLALVDRSVHLMKPGYMLGRSEIFEELKHYDLNNLPFEQSIDWWRMSRSRRSAVWWDNAFSRDAKYAFLESGLVVMTDVIRLDHKTSTRLFPQLVTQSMRQTTRVLQSPPDDARSHRNRVRRRHRTFFPETWMWKCFNVSSGRKNFTLTVPDSITTWQADAVSMNPQSGIGLSDSENIRSFKDFFIDFNIPYSVIRDEEIRIPLTVYNYMDTCVRVNLNVMLPLGISFTRRGVNQMRRHMCVQPRKTATTQVPLTFAHLGKMNITASADAIIGSSSCCPDHEGHHSVISTDLITRSVLVEAEGIKREYTHSVYFCPNERINITTPSSYTFQFMKLPTNMTGFQFLTKAKSNVHIILTQEQSVTDNSYEIVLGGSQNERSWISRNSQRLVTAATNEILSSDEFRPFWITWAGGNIQMGTGRAQTPDSRFMQWWREQGGNLAGDFRYVGFATSDGAEGEFRLWRKEESGGSFNEFFNLQLPLNTVKGSERATASMIGDVMGPTLNNLNGLLRLPFGCGEQNLANFAPNIYVLKYLRTTKQLTNEVRDEAMFYLRTGYQRQLTYKRRDHSYSAFGDRDSSGSMWLTSFVLKSFAQARDFIYIDPGELHDAKEWIVSWQHRSGAFPAVGRIWNQDIQAGVDSDVALTAYVTISLLEAGLEREDEKIAVMKAREFLEAHAHEDTDSYTASLTAYALTLLKSDFSAQALARLAGRAVNASGVTYWEIRERSGEETFGLGDSMKQTVAAAEVEMTSYALLTYTHMRNVTAALPIVKWLSQKRNAIGGFSSTQDTCVALQSLSEYAIFSYIGGVNLVVELATTNLDYAHRFELNNENSEVLQTANIPSLPTNMFVEATGDGCGLLQIDVSYNIPDPESQESFYISIRHHVIPRDDTERGSVGQTDGALPHVVNRYNGVRYEMEACVRWLHRGASNMAVLEFNLLTGFRPDLESVHRVLETNTINLKRYEVSGRTILFYFDEISSTCRSCVRFIAIKEYDMGKVKPQPVKIYDYYEPAYETVHMYGPSASMMETSCPNNTDCDGTRHAEEYEGDCSTSLLGCGEDFGECHCQHDCDFGGPPVCGSNGVVYINRCRMQTAACELNKNIEVSDDEFCQRAPEATQPTLPHDIEENEEKVVPDDTYYDNFFEMLNDDPSAFRETENIVIPEVESVVSKKSL